jgi:hypothetical protein
MGHLEVWISVCFSINVVIDIDIPPHGESPSPSKSMITYECSVRRLVAGLEPGALMLTIGKTANISPLLMPRVSIAESL